MAAVAAAAAAAVAAGTSATTAWLVPPARVGDAAKAATAYLDRVLDGREDPRVFHERLPTLLTALLGNGDRPYGQRTVHAPTHRAPECE
jgi:hypothetical protein